MNRAHEAYLTQKILAADPVELVRMLYRGLSESVEAARVQLASRNIRARSAAISKAVDILAELGGTLDHKRAPELSRSLAALYDYMQRRLLEANFRQADAPLAEVQDLVHTLAEGWHGVSGDTTATVAPAAAQRPAAPKNVWVAWKPAAPSREPELALHG